MTPHYNIATAGIRAGHRILAKLGFGYSVEVVITPIIPHPSGGGGYIYDDTIQYDITFIIKWNDRIVVKRFRNILFDTIANISIKIKKLSIAVKYIGSNIISTYFYSKLNSTKSTPIDISVKDKPIIILAKRKLK